VPSLNTTVKHTRQKNELVFREDAMRHTRRILIVAILSVLLTSLPASTFAQAQPGGSPLVLLIDGDLWTLPPSGGELTALTHMGHVSSAHMSPDGTRVAYLVSSPVTVDAIQRVGGIGGGPLPVDIWYTDINTDADIPVASQPPTASFFVENVPDDVWLRSEPTWSPDGTRIAWAEVHYPSFAPETNRLVIYDVATRATQILLTDLPPASYIPGPQSVMWGAGGLALIAHTYHRVDGSTITNYITVMVYDLDGTLRAETRFYESELAHERAIDYYWMNQLGRDYIAVRFADGHWTLFDPAMGMSPPVAVVGYPELYSPLAPAGSLALVMSFDPTVERASQNRIWSAYVTDRQFIGELDYHREGLAIAPDGMAVAFKQDDQIIIWEGGAQQSAISLPDNYVGAVLWGPTAWRITPALSVECAGTLPSRLVAGGQARVIPNTSANNLREQPTIASSTVAQLPPGEPFAVVSGPECADGMAWWQVKYADTLGWTAEGDSNGYWLEPIDYATLEL
jgi:hypothetical protein